MKIFMYNNYYTIVNEFSLINIFRAVLKRVWSGMSVDSVSCRPQVFAEIASTSLENDTMIEPAVLWDPVMNCTTAFKSRQTKTS